MFPEVGRGVVGRYFKGKKTKDQNFKELALF
jgi:hypothetical protein